MTGSDYFREYDFNLRRLHMFEWLLHEQARRQAENRSPAERPRAEKPYWIASAEQQARLSRATLAA